MKIKPELHAQSASYRPLNTKQLDRIKLVYTLRFVTAPLLAQYLMLHSRQAMFRALENLASQGYLGRRTDPTPFNNKGTRYYVSPQGLRLLKNDPSISRRALGAQHRNSQLSEAYVDHTIETFKILLVLGRTIRSGTRIMVKTQLVDHEYFPKTLPDLFVDADQLIEKKLGGYMIFNFVYIPNYVIKRHLQALVDHIDSGDWEAATGSSYPEIFCICTDDRAATLVRREIARYLQNMGIDDLIIRAITLRELTQLSFDNKL